MIGAAAVTVTSSAAAANQLYIPPSDMPLTATLPGSTSRGRPPGNDVDDDDDDDGEEQEEEGSSSSFLPLSLPFFVVVVVVVVLLLLFCFTAHLTCINHLSARRTSQAPSYKKGRPADE